MANKIVAVLYFAFCSYLFVANVVDANRENHLACAAVPDGTFVRSAISCGHYYLCANEVVVSELKCPDRYLFSEEKQLCDFAKFVNCNSCLQYGRPYFADPTNCRNYFKCVNGHRRTYHCPSGQLFDEISNRCQHSEDVNCNLDDDEVPPIDTTTTPADNQWPVPEGIRTRPPPIWGPPKAPSGGENANQTESGEEEAEEEPKSPRPTRRPGGVGYVQ